MVQGVNLSSVRGLLLVTGCAPHGNGLICTRTTFFTRAAQLITMPGLYQHLVDELHLTIAMVPGLTTAQAADNVMVEDMACLFAKDGVTIPQVGDAYEWGHMALIGWSQGTDAAWRMEAMSALQVACQQSGLDNADHLTPLEPRWWYAPAEISRGTSGQTVPTARSQVPAEWVVPPPTRQLLLLGPVDDATAGWTGTTVHYISQKPRKKRKTMRGKRWRAAEEASDNKPLEFEMDDEPVDGDMNVSSGGQGPQAECSTTDNLESLGELPGDMAME